MARPFSERPLDFVYFMFFLVSAPSSAKTGTRRALTHGQIHIPATVCLDVQSLYPREWVPSFLSWIPSYYVAISGDPFLAASFGFTDNATEYLWFTTLLHLEL